MEFSIQLSADYPDKTYGGDRVYGDMLEQAVLGDRLGYEGVSLTEHHLTNVLMNPAPLQLAVLIAARTERLNIMTSVVVLPIHDMRLHAGEIVVADILTGGRLLLGIGRGAFRYEIERFGIPMEETRARFDESLAVLQALLTREEVSWDGDYYKFDPITIMPRPMRPGGPPMVMAVMNPEGIYHCTKRGFHIQTTPLAGNHQLLVDQVASFTRARDERNDEEGERLTLSLSRVAFVARTDRDRRAAIETAHNYYSRFDNLFTGPGVVENGMASPLPRKQSMEELAENLLVCTPPEMIDKLAPYADLGIDRVILNVNFGMEPLRTLDGLQCFAEEVMPHFTAPAGNP